MEEKIISLFKENDIESIKDLLKDKSSSDEIGKYLFEMTRDNKKLLINGKDKLADFIKFLDKCGYEFAYETDYGNNLLMGRYTIIM